MSELSSNNDDNSSNNEDDRVKEIKSIKEKYDTLSVMYEQERKSYSARMSDLQSKFNAANEENITLHSKLNEIQEERECQTINTDTTTKTLTETVKMQAEKIKSVTAENQLLGLKFGSFRKEIERNKDNERKFDQIEQKYISRIESLVSEIHLVKKAIASEKPDPNTSSTNVDLKIQAALVSLKYIKHKCQDSIATNKDYNKLQKDMEELKR